MILFFHDIHISFLGMNTNCKIIRYNNWRIIAECAIVQAFPHVPSVMVRFPFVIGADDYTKRLHFYVEHILNKKPMYIDNLNSQMAFISSDEAGKFLAFLGNSNFNGSINAASEQTISIAEIINYVNTKTGLTPILSDDGEPAPYNGANDYYLNIDESRKLGFSFTPLPNWIYDLIDTLIIQTK